MTAQKTQKKLLGVPDKIAVLGTFQYKICYSAIGKTDNIILM
jgi:hypothetical protein